MIASLFAALLIVVIAGLVIWCLRRCRRNDYLSVDENEYDVDIEPGSVDLGASSRTQISIIKSNKMWYVPVHAAGGRWQCNRESQTNSVSIIFALSYSFCHRIGGANPTDMREVRAEDPIDHKRLKQLEEGTLLQKNKYPPHIMSDLTLAPCGIGENRAVGSQQLVSAVMCQLLPLAESQPYHSAAAPQHRSSPNPEVLYAGARCHAQPTAEKNGRHLLPLSFRVLRGREWRTRSSLFGGFAGGCSDVFDSCAVCHQQSGGQSERDRLSRVPLAVGFAATESASSCQADTHCFSGFIRCFFALNHKFADARWFGVI